MNESMVWEVVKAGEGLGVNEFLNYIGDKFKLPTHKWSVFDDENAPLFDLSEKVVYSNDGYEVFTFDLDLYDNVGHIKTINYDLLLNN